jgi:hypothetical protein
MNIIAIGDIHNHWVEAEQIASLYDKTHLVIFTGDYFDDFGDTAEDAKQTAFWLKKSLAKPNRIHLMGNHDINYSYLNYTKDSNGNLQNIYNCSGYDMKKDHVINSVMFTTEWEQIKFAHYENGFWFTHAGIHPHWFEHPIKGMDNDVIKEKIAKADEDYHNRTWNETIGAVGRCRGGMQKVGGILWCDDFQEGHVSRGLKQVFGHTPTMAKATIWYENGGINANIDCGLNQVLEIDEDGSCAAIDTGLPNFYLAARKKSIKKELDKKLQNIGAFDHIYKELN